jgi:hypothetical protein
MTTPASVASIHLGPINASRKRAGLPAMTLAEAELEFAAANLSPFRKAARPKFSSTGAADGMWGGIVAKLNSTLPTRPPIAAGHPSPESSDGDGRVDAVVDWSALARNLNASAGLATPGRRAR